MANDCDEELPRFTTVARKRNNESDDTFGVLDREDPYIAWFADDEEEVVKWAGWLNSGSKPRDTLFWTKDEVRV